MASRRTKRQEEDLNFVVRHFIELAEQNVSAEVIENSCKILCHRYDVKWDEAMSEIRRRLTGK